MIQVDNCLKNSTSSSGDETKALKPQYVIKEITFQTARDLNVDYINQKDFIFSIILKNFLYILFLQTYFPYIIVKPDKCIVTNVRGIIMEGPRRAR